MCEPIFNMDLSDDVNRNIAIQNKKKIEDDLNIDIEDKPLSATISQKLVSAIDYLDVTHLEVSYINDINKQAREIVDIIEDYFDHMQDAKVLYNNDTDNTGQKHSIILQLGNEIYEPNMTALRKKGFSVESLYGRKNTWKYGLRWVGKN